MLPNFVRAVFGSVSVEEKNGKIKINALRSKDALREIYLTWKTSRIEASMFTKVSPYTLEFYSFFAVEFAYILDELIAKKGRSAIAKSTLRSVKNGLLQNTWLKNTITDHPSILNRNRLSIFSKTPLEHQNKFFDHLDDVVPKFMLNGYTLGAGTGTGKTFMTLAACAMLEPDITIVVCLKAGIYRVWEAAMKEDFKKTPSYWIYDRDKTLPSTLPEYLIYHFEALPQLLNDAGRFGGKKVALIFDESHNLNEVTAGRTQAAMAFCDRVKPLVTLWASATPIKAMGAEAIPMLASFDPLMTKEVQQAFKQLYGKSATKCFDIIRHRMGNVVFRIDVVKSQPIIKDIPVTLKNPREFLLSTLKDDMKAYITERIKFWKQQMPEVERVYYGAVKTYEKTLNNRQAKDELAYYRRAVDAISDTRDYESVKDEMVFCNHFEKNKIEPTLPKDQIKLFRSYKSVIKYLPLKVRGECLGNVVGKRREEVTVAIIDACKLPEYINNAQKKTIVFTSYVKAVEEVTAYLKMKGFKPVPVYGGGKDDLTSQVKKFFDDANANPCVATFQSLSTSVPLTVANTILAINVPFRDHTFEQAVGRIDRINQDTQTYVFKFYLDTGSEPNISTRTMDILAWSGEQVNHILGVKEEAVALESLQHDLGKLRNIPVPVGDDSAYDDIWDESFFNWNQGEPEDDPDAILPGEPVYIEKVVYSPILELE